MSESFEEVNCGLSKPFDPLMIIIISLFIEGVQKIRQNIFDAFNKLLTFCVSEIAVAKTHTEYIVRLPYDKMISVY